MTTHLTVGSAGEIDKAREHLDELRAQIDNLPGEIDQAYANGDPAMARRLDNRLQVARRQVNDAAETLARLERPAVDVERLRADAETARAAAWCTAEVHHPVQAAFDDALEAWHVAENRVRVLTDQVRSGRIVDLSDSILT